MSDDRTQKVWDVACRRELRTLAGLSGWDTAVMVTPDSRRAVVRAGNGRGVPTFTCAGVASAFSDALKLIVAGDAGGHIHFLHLEEPKPNSQGIDRRPVTSSSK